MPVVPLGADGEWSAEAVKLALSPDGQAEVRAALQEMGEAAERRFPTPPPVRVVRKGWFAWSEWTDTVEETEAENRRQAGRGLAE